MAVQFKDAQYLLDSLVYPSHVAIFKLTSPTRKIFYAMFRDGRAIARVTEPDDVNPNNKNRRWIRNVTIPDRAIWVKSIFVPWYPSEKA